MEQPDRNPANLRWNGCVKDIMTCGSQGGIVFAPVDAEVFYVA